LLTKLKQNPAAFNLTLAMGISILLGIIPFAEIGLFPLRLLITYFHEGAHALASVITLGHVDSLKVNWNTSGVTMTRGGFAPLISSAGYLGTTLLGAAMIWFSRKERGVRNMLTVLGVSLVVMAVLWGGGAFTLPAMLMVGGSVVLGIQVARGKIKEKYRMVAQIGSLLGLILPVAFLAMSGAILTCVIGLGFGVVLVWVGRKASIRIARFVLAFLAVQTSFNALADLKNLLGLSWYSNTHTDAQNMAKMFGLPPTFWAVLWGVISMAILVATLVRFYRHPVFETPVKQLSPAELR
jgi:hypothetical protein